MQDCIGEMDWRGKVAATSRQDIDRRGFGRHIATTMEFVLMRWGCPDGVVTCYKKSGRIKTSI